MHTRTTHAHAHAHTHTHRRGGRRAQVISIPGFPDPSPPFSLELPEPSSLPTSSILPTSSKSCKTAWRHMEAHHFLESIIHPLISVNIGVPLCFSFHVHILADMFKLATIGMCTTPVTSEMVCGFSLWFPDCCRNWWSYCNLRFCHVELDLHLIPGMDWRLGSLYNK